MTAYLDLLDAVLLTGLHTVGPAFTDVQAAYVLSLQTPEGGFAGREGGADLYYTDFAVRLLALLAPDSPALPAAAQYVGRAAPPADIVGLFNLLNCLRLLVQCGHRVTLDLAGAGALLRQRRLAGGGFARPGAAGPSAYQTFLAALCYELLGEPLPAAEAAAQAVAGLQGPAGGFREQPGVGVEQTNATAAAVAFLLLGEQLGEEQGARAATFLQQMQAADGGFLAHAAAPCGDLLSTFTALATLVGLDRLAQADLAGVARFLRRTADPRGGFRGAPADTAADVEYTYYGVGCLALLQAALGE